MWVAGATLMVGTLALGFGWKVEVELQEELSAIRSELDEREAIGRALLGSLSEESEEALALADVRRVLGGMAAPVRPRRGYRGFWLEAILVVCGLSWVAGLWVWWRTVRPLGLAVFASRASRPGDGRFVRPQGGRLARTIADALNLQSERAQRGMASVPPEGLVHAEAALKGLGQGDLRPVRLDLGPGLERLARRINETKADLQATLAAKTTSAEALCVAVQGMAEGAQELGVQFSAQQEALKGLAEEAGQTSLEIRRAQRGLEGALSGLVAMGQAQRRGFEETRRRLVVLMREAQMVHTGLVKARSLCGRREGLHGALMSLRRAGQGAQTPGGLELRSQLREWMAEGHAAMESAEASIAQLGSRVSALVRGLEEVAQTLPKPPLENQLGHATDVLFRMGSVFVRSAERAKRGAVALSQSNSGLVHASGRIFQGASVTLKSVPGLLSLFQELQGIEAFEREFQSHLEGLRGTFSPVPTVGALSPAGGALLEGVRDSAQAADARLSALIAATETTLDAFASR